MSWDSEQAVAVDAKLRADGSKGLDARITRLSGALDSIGNRTERLTELLTPVLSEERPTPGLVRQGGDDSGSSLGRILYRLAEQAEHLTDALDTLGDRVDL